MLIDGGTIYSYSPFFHNVIWNQHEVMLDDVDRIEVISGPGGTLWGANAVNGLAHRAKPSLRASRRGDQRLWHQRPHPAQRPGRLAGELLIVAPRTTALNGAACRRLALAAVLLAFVFPPSLAADNDSSAAVVKATYLYKFAPFVEWPSADAAASGIAPMHFCVVRDDAFGGLLEEAVAGQRIGERPVTVRRLDTVDRQSGCHIMYIGGSGSQPPTDILDTVRGMPVLTVTDSMRDPVSKGIINFVIENNRVRFEINNRAAAENGLVISSKLLSLGTAVRPQDLEP